MKRLILIAIHPELGLIASLVVLPKFAKDICLGNTFLGKSDEFTIIANVEQLKTIASSLGWEYKVQPIDSLGNPL